MIQDVTPDLDREVQETVAGVDLRPPPLTDDTVLSQLAQNVGIEPFQPRNRDHQRADAVARVLGVCCTLVREDLEAFTSALRAYARRCRSIAVSRAVLRSHRTGLILQGQ